MAHYLGIDAGGTKTHCLVADESGRIAGFGRAGTGNYEGFGVEPAAIEIRKAVSTALAEAGLRLNDITGIGLGIAGADVPGDYTMLEAEIFTPLFAKIPRRFCNDSMAGLRGGTRAPKGVVIACGTGCVCAGMDGKGQETRVGGINDEFGDIVSGTTLGQEGLRVVWRARDTICPESLLTERFLAKAGCADVDEFFHKMYTQEITQAELEPMAVIVFDAALDGDAAACDILEWGGRYLGKMVNAAAKRLEMSREPFDVVMAGSVFKGSSPVLIDAMRTVIHRECPHATLIMPAFEPVVGALLLGLELDQEVTDALYATLSHELDLAAERWGVTFKAG